MASLTQRIILRLMPGRAKQIESESRAWIITCPNCGLEQSYWDIGGVRYGAKSMHKSIGIKCRACGKRGMHPVVHRPE